MYKGGSRKGFRLFLYCRAGACGEVLRHNQQADINASPFFYGDVENMLEIIEAAERMRVKAKLEDSIVRYGS